MSAVGERATPPTPPAPAAPLRLLRFDRVQRVAHWANAVLFGILILTALPLYFSSIERVVGRHVLLVQIHVWSGVALPVPLLVAMAGPWGTRLRRDVRRFNRWTEDEIRWLRTLGWRGRAADKFNPGQKLNAIFVGGAIAVMLGTGIVLRWFGLFPLDWRSGATFVHEVLAFLIVIVVAGHIVMALTHPQSLRSMFGGWISRSWAAQHAPGWLAEEVGGEAAAVPAAASAGGQTTPSDPASAGAPPGFLTTPAVPVIPEGASARPARTPRTRSKRV